MNAATTVTEVVKQGYRALLHLTDWASYVILATMAIVVCVDILCRYLLGFSTQIAEEVASLGLVSLIFVSLPGAFHDNAFLRVDALYRLFSGRLKSALDLLFHLAAVAVTVIYSVYVGKLVADSFAKDIRSDTFLGTPNFLPQSAMFFGLCVLLVALVAGILRSTARSETAPSNDD